jgi:hypothetical protein
MKLSENHIFSHHKQANKRKNVRFQTFARCAPAAQYKPETSKSTWQTTQPNHVTKLCAPLAALPPLAGLRIPPLTDCRHWPTCTSRQKASDYAASLFDTTMSFSAFFARHNAVRNCSLALDWTWCFHERPVLHEPEASVPRLTRIRSLFATFMAVAGFVSSRRLPSQF